MNVASLISYINKAEENERDRSNTIRYLHGLPMLVDFNEFYQMRMMELRVLLRKQGGINDHITHEMTCLSKCHNYMLDKEAL